MRGTLKTLQAMQWGMLASILVYAGIGEVPRWRAAVPDPSLSYIFTTAGVAIVGVIFVIRRTLVLRFEPSLAAHPDDPVDFGSLEERLCCHLYFVRSAGLVRLGFAIHRLQFSPERALLHRRLRAAVLLRT